MDGLITHMLIVLWTVAPWVRSEYHLARLRRPKPPQDLAQSG